MLGLIFMLFYLALWLITIMGIISGFLTIIAAIKCRHFERIFTGIGLILLGFVFVQLLRGA